jgi:hypothetical protein
MKRRRFLQCTSSAAILSTPVITTLGGCTGSSGDNQPAPVPLDISESSYPYAITMWDFSWIERRWPGAGYEDWDRALDELTQRGYNAVRIDAFPHLVATDPSKEWTLIPVWSVEDWGSPASNKIVIQPALNQFIAKCKERGIKVGLSSWFRQDADDVRMKITTPEIMAEQWIKTLEGIADDGLLDAILYVDLCNEWPGLFWAPYFKNTPPDLTWGGWYTEPSLLWMKKSVEMVREAFPDTPLTYSFDANEEQLRAKDVSFLDFLEPHLWMAQRNGQEFCKATGYEYELFNNKGYEALAKNGKRVYVERKQYWDELLTEKIRSTAEMSRKTGHPLMTTECWAVVNYKDWPLLEWDWIKEICALGVDTAASTGRWLAIATSNFCGPQFAGMWTDVEWHLKMTGMIRNSVVEESLMEYTQQFKI